MELNLKQKKILKLLAINCRFSNKDIAKAIGASEESVAYQIQKLIFDEELGFFNTQFVHMNLGYTSHHHWIKFADKISVEKLKKIPHVNSINPSIGKYDYQILSYTKTKKELAEVRREIKKLNPLAYASSELVEQYKKFTNIIPDIDVQVKIPKNNKKFEYVFNSKAYADPFFDQKTKLDAKDKKIIEVLIKNPRASFQEISKEAEVNHETARYRIKKYILERLINNFGIVWDFKKCGLYNTYFLLRLGKFDEKEFEKFLKENKNIIYTPKLEGDYNAIVYVVSKNPWELGEIYDGLIEVLGKAILEMDLIFWKETHKYEQFPVKIFEGKN